MSEDYNWIDDPEARAARTSADGDWEAKTSKLVEGIIQKEVSKTLNNMQVIYGSIEAHIFDEIILLEESIIAEIIEHRNGDHGDNYILLKVLIGRNGNEPQD